MIAQILFWIFFNVFYYLTLISWHEILSLLSFTHFKPLIFFEFFCLTSSFLSVYYIIKQCLHKFFESDTFFLIFSDDDSRLYLFYLVLLSHIYFALYVMKFLV